MMDCANDQAPDAATPETRTSLLVVTGPSGAGRSTAVNVLEDVGFEVIDNLPLSLMPKLLSGPPLSRPLAIVVDVRNRDFSTAAVIEMMDGMANQPAVGGEVLYLDCRADVLARRFSETRRRHPLAPTEDPSVGIERELDLLRPIQARADFLIDTSEMTPHDLKEELLRQFDRTAGKALAISIQSFAYKRGIPRGVDMIFDCRFLRNPYWETDLRSADGRDQKVAEFVEQDVRFAPFLDRVIDLTHFLLPAYSEEGKTHLSIAFGCTGGQHRSVAVAEKVANALAASEWQVSKRHRELDRRSGDMPASVV